MWFLVILLFISFLDYVLVNRSDMKLAKEFWTSRLGWI